MSKFTHLGYFLAAGALLLQSADLCAQQRIQFRTPREAVVYYENLVGTLTRQVRSMQDESAVTASTVQALQRKINAMEEEQKALRQEVHRLRTQISADAQSRKSQLDALADQIMKRPSGDPTPDSGRRKAVRKRQKPEQKHHAAEQEFIEHTVEAGTTLSAIARAYKVSIKDIERVNKIRKGIIYAGQKLLIPVSDKR